MNLAEAHTKRKCCKTRVSAHWLSARLGFLYRLRNGYRSGVNGGSLWVTLMKRCFTTLWKSQSIFRFFSIIITHP